jgi:PAS domain-containing protein
VTIEEYEKIFYTLIDTANDAIFIADAETGFIISANKQAEKPLGIPLNKTLECTKRRCIRPMNLVRTGIF